MKSSFIVLIILVFNLSVNAQSITGKWKTIDDKTGEAKSIVEIYEKEGKLQGKIIEIFDKSKRDLPCIKCKGDDYNKPILGLVIIKDMTKDGKYYKNGTIVDPQNGKQYDLRLGLSDNKLQVRGYIGFFYSTQYWVKVQ